MPTAKMQHSAEKVPESARKVPDNAEKVPENAEKVPESAEEYRKSARELPEQQALIYQVIAQNGKITSAEVESLLGIKQRRARVILKTMTENGIIRKVGAAQSTKYILDKK